MKGKDVFTGVPSIDQAVKGFRSDELIVIGGRPAMGCTAFGLTTMLNSNQKASCLYISLWETVDKLEERIRQAVKTLGSDLTVEMSRRITNMISIKGTDVSHIVLHGEFKDTQHICEVIGSFVQFYKFGLVMIDGLDKFGVSHSLFSKKKKYLKSFRQLKAIAQCMDIPVMLLTGIHRRVVGPKSGCYGQYAAREKVADWILIIHNWGYYGEQYDNADQLVSADETNINIGKSKRQLKEYDIRLCLKERVFFPIT